MPFGVFRDERYRILEGNDSVAKGLAARLARGQLRGGLRLVGVRKTSGGRIELALADGNRTLVAAHDAVVIAIPFSVLRGVELDESLGLPAWKKLAIAELGYGTNQATWEANPSRATAERAILTDYSSGARGASLDPARTQTEAARFLADLDVVFPGARAAASTKNGKIEAHLEAWLQNPLSIGSYTCYRPGQFTTIAGNEGKPMGNLFFAGEHTNSFYEWQGFMEGACLSGIQAASDVLAAARAGSF